jgi:hypothetical protein
VATDRMPEGPKFEAQHSQLLWEMAESQRESWQVVERRLDRIADSMSRTEDLEHRLSEEVAGLHERVKTLEAIHASDRSNVLAVRIAVFSAAAAFAAAIGAALMTRG